MRIIEKIKAKAKILNARIVLPEADDERVLRAAEGMVKEKVGIPIILGDSIEIQERADKAGISLEGVEIVNPKAFHRLDKYVERLFELRQEKGMTMDEAKRILTTNVNFFGAMMVKMRDADGMVSGSNSPTADVLRAGLQVIGTKPGIRTISSIFLMELKYNTELYGEILTFADCAVIPTPTSEQLADIAEEAALATRTLADIEPVVALMTFSTKGSAKHESIRVIKRAGELLTERKVNFQFDDEIQADAALVPEVAALKCPTSKAAGRANVLIFPNLAAGNIGYKLVQRLANADAYGPIVQGLAAPINDLSRGCSFQEIIETAAITAVQSKSK